MLTDYGETNSPMGEEGKEKKQQWSRSSSSTTIFIHDHWRRWSDRVIDASQRWIDALLTFSFLLIYLFSSYRRHHIISRLVDWDWDSYWSFFLREFMYAVGWSSYGNKINQGILISSV